MKHKLRASFEMATTEVTEEHFFVSLHMLFQLETEWVSISTVLGGHVFFYVSFRVVGPAETTLFTILGVLASISKLRFSHASFLIFLHYRNDIISNVSWLCQSSSWT